MGDKVIGVIGGSGLYQIDTLEAAEWTTLQTPWGDPSDAILVGTIKGTKMAFLPRHGRGHVHSPSTVPYRANMDALKQLGVTDILSVSACGSFRDEMAPGDFVLCDQFIDRTVGRASSFFGSGCVAHVSLAHPTCDRLRAATLGAAQGLGITVHDGGCYLAMEGPQFSTLAESRMYRESWGADVIGMTNMPEAKLAREAEMCYLTVAMVTDYDSWHPDHGEVDINKLLATLSSNVAHGAALVAAMPTAIADRTGPCPHGCDTALDFAVMTAPDRRDPALVADLQTVAGRVLGPGNGIGS